MNQNWTPGPPPPPAAGTQPITEDSVALTFAQNRQADLRFDHDARAWFRWNGTAWRQEKTKLAFSWARQIARDLAAQSENFRAQLTCGKAAFAAGVEKFAQSDRAFAVTHEIWDRDPFLLGTTGGTVDLRTGQLRPARQQDYITKLTAVAPAETANCPIWLKFLNEITQDNAELVAFLKRWFGYCLTGDTREESLVFAWGTGENGKGTTMGTVSGIMGDYCTTAAMDSFVVTKSDKHTTDMAMLAGARMVLTTEVDEGQAWAEGKVKQLTGRDPVTARFMRQDNFTYLPQFKLTISGNHKPRLNNVDDAMKRRLNLAPFLFKPAVKDPTLKDRLRKEWPEILRWVINGCLEWQRDGLKPPSIVQAATQDYFEAQDFFGRWLEECCKLAKGLEIKPAALLASFQDWCQKNGEKVPDNRSLRGKLEGLPGVEYTREFGKPRMVSGIGLNRPEPPPGQENRYPWDRDDDGSSGAEPY